MKANLGRSKRQKLKKKLAFLDLYNVHLDTDSILKSYREKKKIIFSQGEKDKLMRFFEEYAPDFVKHRTAEEVKRAYPMNRDGRLVVDIDKVPYSLGWYEHHASISWFQSEHFIRFIRQCHLLRRLVDDWVDKKEISSQSLGWLLSESFTQKLKLLWMGPNGKVYRSLKDSELQAKLRDDPSSKVKLRVAWKTVTSETISPRDPFPTYGGTLKPIFQRIWTELADLVNDEYKIARCAYRNCHNVFRKVRITHKHCSRQCRSRVSSTRYRHKWYHRDRNI